MDVVIAGGHGQIALLLERLLSDRGDRVRGLIRNPEHAADLRAVGAEPVVCDLESEKEDLARAVAGADAVVFAAGAGPGSDDSRKRSMDLGGAVGLIEAARAGGIHRYVMVSAMGAASADREAREGFAGYLSAKAEADERLAASGLDFTIVRPGRLTDDQATGMVTASSSVERGQIPRADVAAALVAVLAAPNTIGATIELVSGEIPIVDAVAAL